MHKLIRELRSREVFRTAVLYVGISWILIEAASVMLPAFDAPDWALRAVIILAIVGLPVVTVLGGHNITDNGTVFCGVPSSILKWNSGLSIKRPSVP